MARENNIDLGRLKGTGAGGRITKQDLENYMAQAAPSAAASVPSATTGELLSVWASGPCDVWAIGDAVYHAQPVQGLSAGDAPSD